MSRTKLTDEEVATRMVELRNLRTLHARDRKQITEIKAENAELCQMVATLQIQVAELQTTVFGKKKRPPMGGTPIGADLTLEAKNGRSKDLYRRPLPPASAVTKEVALPLPETCHGVVYRLRRYLREPANHLKEPHDKVVQTAQSDEVGADLQETISAVYPRVIDSGRLMEVMLGMFALRAQDPIKFVLLHENCIAFTNKWNQQFYLGYAGPPNWTSHSGWLYVVSPESSEVALVFSLFADLARALCNTFPEICSPELGSSDGALVCS